ncbi:DgyrCDS10735 [Dimorphilus gyrociliatus]|uniref:DgyrCDS10735 n=1 Tax=Dimorphilus gyrociliatus TaxID=2664684 RepID=A0A7I8W177_9ANNE|nr:DgyrCDS10735 [Dimorphilus gyrociliatus]
MFSLQELILRSIDFDGSKGLGKYFKNDKTIPHGLAEEILQYFNNKHIGVSKEHLKYFTFEKTTLTCIKLNGCRIYDELSFINFVKNHPLKVIEMNNLKIDLKQWIGNINTSFLEELTISNCRLYRESYNFQYSDILERIEDLQNFKNLLKLDVSYTLFTNECLLFISNELSQLENLDISYTLVDTIHPIKKLESLTNFTFISQKESWKFDEIQYLKEFEHLKEISVGNNHSIHNCRLCKWFENFLDNNQFKALESLVIGEIQHVEIAVLSKFIKNHERLKYFAIDLDVRENNLADLMENRLNVIYPLRITLKDDRYFQLFFPKSSNIVFKRFYDLAIKSLELLKKEINECREIDKRRMYMMRLDIERLWQVMYTI